MLKDTRARVEVAERRIQMLTDSFVVSGIWRNASSLGQWTKSMAAANEDVLQFEMTDD
jgi:hypothetical protein